MTDFTAQRSWIQQAFDSGIGRPIIPEPIPNLEAAAIPKQVGTHLNVDQFDILDAGCIADLVREINEKLTAEDDRMRRLLPPAPEGHAWVSELAFSDEIRGFGAEMTVRLRYRLLPIMEGGAS